MADTAESEMISINSEDNIKEKASASGSKDAENVRKSSRIKMNSRFEKHMSDYVLFTRRRGRSPFSESDDEDVPPKVAKKTETRGRPKSSKPVGRPPKNKSPIKVEVKEEPVGTTTDEEEVEDEEAEDQDPSDKDFSLSMLNLRRVGDEAPRTTKHSIPLNARGMPQRIRKKNRLFYDDDILTTPSKKEKGAKKAMGEKKSEKRGQKIRDDRKEEETKPIIYEDNREANSIRQKIGMKLRNLLKLPKAQRWVLNEFFYSTIDNVLFFGINDFMMCLKETFPHLKTTKMTRTEWCAVRRLIGKPRRCSQNFFREERITLETRRNLIRQIQQRTISNVQECKQLPDRIPLQLSVSSRVTAKLRRPQSGLFTGKVDAVDPSNHTYRITFDRPGLGTHSIPDYEVMMDGEVDYISLNKWIKRYSTIKQNCASPKPRLMWPDSLERETWTGNIANAIFPKQFYEMIVRICKILKEKRAKMLAQRKLNAEAEKMTALTQKFPAEFQRRYAAIIIDLESLNISLKRYLFAVQKLCHEIAPDICSTVMLSPSYLRAKSITEAKGMVDNYFQDKPPLKNKDLIELVTELVALVIQVQNVTMKKCSVQERQVLQQSIAKIKQIISPKNLPVFQNSVEVHIQFIETIGQENHHLSPLLSVAPN